jgi:hypothetical protein
MNITPEKTVVEMGPRGIKSPLQLARSRGEGCGAFVPNEARVRYQIETGTSYDLPHEVYFEKAGPREGLFFEPRETKAAVVTLVLFTRVSTTLFALRCSSFIITMACRKCWAFATGTRVSTRESDFRPSS